MVEVETLVGSALTVLGTLFARTARKAGEDLADATASSAARKVAELVCQRLGPDHPLTRVLQQAQREPGSQDSPLTCGLSC